jgi:asparagine synthase (glutamine-hydrolysing)
MRFLPEDRFDRQPLESQDGRLVLVADCRLDNREELGDLLGIPPGRQALMCDAAFILAAAEKWGEATPEKLCGDYAFALWDAGQRRLLLARDHLDGRPLHYHIGNGWVAFASMPKGLLALPEIPAGHDPLRLVLWQMLLPLTGPESFYRSIRRLEPGHLAVFSADGACRIRRHWDAAAIAPSRPMRPADEAEALRDVLKNAVRARLRGTGNVGLMLSGGLDSSAVAALAAPLLSDAGQRLTAYTSVPDPTAPVTGNPYWITDEGPLAARMAASHPAIDHYLIPSGGSGLLEAMERLIFLADQPVMNPTNSLWLHRIYQQAGRDRVPIVLTGTRGNMALTYHGHHRMDRQLRQGDLPGLWRSLSVVAREGLCSRAEVLRGLLRPYVPETLKNLRGRLWGGRDLRRQFLPVNFDRLADFNLPPDIWRGPEAGPPVRRWQEWAAMVFSLMDGGPMNAAINAGYGVDRRDPTGDRRVLEFCLSRPEESFLANGRSRDLFRRAFAAEIPAEILGSTRRGLQAADWKMTLQSEQTAILDEISRQETVPECMALTDLGALTHLARTLETANPDDPSSVRGHQFKLTRGLSAGIFTRRSTGRNN